MPGEPSEVSKPVIIKPVHTHKDIHNGAQKNSTLPPAFEKTTSQSKQPHIVKRNGSLQWILGGVTIILILVLAAGFVWVYNLNQRLSATQELLNSKQNASTQIAMPSMEQKFKGVVVIEREISEIDMKNMRNQLVPTFSESDKQIFSTLDGAKSFWTVVGAGAVVDPQVIVTQKNVVFEAGNYRVRTYLGKTLSVTRDSIHPTENMALLRITSEAESLSPIKFSQTLEPSKPLSIITHEQGLEYTFSTGEMVSQRRVLAFQQQYIQEMLEQNSQTGNSKELLLNRYHGQGQAGFIQYNSSKNTRNGGVLLNQQGDLVGIDVNSQQSVSQSARLVERMGSSSTRNNADTEGFAISSEVIQNFVNHYTSKKPMSFLQGYGIQLTPAVAAFWGLPEERGFWLRSLQNSTFAISEPATTPGGNLDRAGLKENDIILSVDDKDITLSRSLGEILDSIEPDTEVSVTFMRQKDDRSWEKKEARLTIAKQPYWTGEDLKNMRLGSLFL
jgi:S1-C subfamily serine protease